MIEIARVCRWLLIHYNHYKIKFVYQHTQKSTMSSEPTPQMPVEVEHSSCGHSHMALNEGIIIILIMLIVYMGFEAFKHKRGISFGHEASLVTLIGFGISYAFVLSSQQDFNELM